MSTTLTYGPVSIFDCETGFDEQTITYVTSTPNGTYRKAGLYSSKIAVASDFTTGLLASKAISSTSFVLATQVRFWIRSTISMDANDLQIMFDNSAGCGTPQATINIGALAANTWSQQTLAIPSPTGLTAIISIGIGLVNNKASFDLYVDKIELVGVSMTFDELHITGFDNPENEEGFPQAEAEQLLDGSWYKTTPVATTRNIYLDLGVIQTFASQVFLRNFQFAETQQITYDSETISVVSTMNSFPVERVNNTTTSKQYTFELKEKTARLIGSAYPTSWTN